MKKLLAFLLSVLAGALLVLPCLAADNGTILYHEEIDLGDGVTVVEELVEYRFARTSEKFESLTRTFYRYGEKVAEITLSGNFSYSGTSALVKSGNVSKTTYNGWTYSQNSLSNHGGTISLSATLSKSGCSSIAVNMSMTCDCNGNISKS